MIKVQTYIWLKADLFLQSLKYNNNDVRLLNRFLLNKMLRKNNNFRWRETLFLRFFAQHNQ